MTQQFDLTFNTTNTMDKMMTQSQSKSYSSSSYADADKFDNFLSNANKSYTQDSTRNDKSQSQSKTNNRQETSNNKSNSTVAENKSEYKESTKYEENSNNVSNENSVKDEKTSLDTKADNKKSEIINDESNLVINEEIVENNEVDVKEMMMVSNAQLSNVEVTSEDVSKLEKSFAMSDVPVDEELPTEAIKSGINLETLSKAIETPVEDTTDVNMQVVDNAVKDSVVSKDDAISAMYKVKTQNVEDTNDVKVDNKVAIAEAKVDTKLETSVETKAEPKINVELDAKVSENVQLSNLEENNLKMKDDLKVVDNADVEVKDVKSDVETKVDVVKEEDFAVKDDVKSNEKTNINDLDKIQLVKDVKAEKDELKATKDVQNTVEELAKNTKDGVIHEVKAVNIDKVNGNQKQETENTVSTDKLNKLQEEVQSAKAENIFETLSTQDEKVSNNDKKVYDKFAKTNVESDETMEIEDDTKGIEFISKKADKVVDKTNIQDKHATNIKDKVENVKIQVEDNVKVVTNQTQDSVKTEKANEAMTKAGLTTKSLREMDGKVTSMETGNQAGAQFGETSQEMLMRDILSHDATAQTGEAKTTVDSTQALNKSTTAQQPQAQQNTQEAQEVNILDQIRAKFAVSKQNGLQKITIGLTPESLGKVTVEIVKGQNGISANLLAENPQAKEILDKNLDGLKSVLQTQGVNVNNVNVKVTEAGRSSENNNNMFQNDDGQFSQDSSGDNSRGNNSSNQEKHSEFEFMNNNSISAENTEPEDVISNTMQIEKTVSIKGGNGKISYKL